MDAWSDDPDYPISDWKYEVQNDDTRLGYLAWIERQRERDAAEDK